MKGFTVLLAETDWTSTAQLIVTTLAAIMLPLIAYLQAMLAFRQKQFDAKLEATRLESKEGREKLIEKTDKQSEVIAATKSEVATIQKQTNGLLEKMLATTAALAEKSAHEASLALVQAVSESGKPSTEVTPVVITNPEPVPVKVDKSK